MDRREFLGGAALLAAVGLTRKASGETAAEAAVASDAAFMKAMAAGRLICSEPMLQAPAETSMGVVWAVTAMANGWVDVSESPDLSNARRYTCGGYGLTGFHERVLQVRLTDLKPATTYYYRIRAERGAWPSASTASTGTRPACDGRSRGVAVGDAAVRGGRNLILANRRR